VQLALVRPVLHALGFVLWLYTLCLAGRMVLEWVRFFARNWRPRGVVLLLAEGIYTITDPPLRLIRRIIPPLRLGGMGLDIAFMVLFFVVMYLSQLLARL
jgi:YggT family protein